MKIKNFKFKNLLSALAIFAYAGYANAGAVINKSPVSLGLILGLVGYWSFDRPNTDRPNTAG